MHLELVDALRCPNDHDDTWLVASIAEWSGRHIMRGTLGCPICHAVYPIEGGAADFTGGEPGQAAAGEQAPEPPADDSSAPRLAALLDLREPGGIVLLAGRYAALADGLESVSAAHYVAIAGALDAAAASPDRLIRVGARLPFASGSVRAAAIEGGMLRALTAGEVTRILRAGGRLVAPSKAPLPAGIRELARDEREWVGERLAEATAPISLQRRR